MKGEKKNKKKRKQEGNIYIKRKKNKLSFSSDLADSSV
jgi:hypothetical protein